MMKKEVRKNMEKVKQLWIKYKEVINYLMFGVLTTLVNYVSYIIFTRVFSVDMFVSNLVAWFLSVVFAFITNKLIVFESKEFTPKVIVKEGVSFMIARVFSLLLDMLILYLMADLLGMNDLIVKIISNVIVIIVNYVLSKFLIFKKEK